MHCVPLEVRTFERRHQEEDATNALKPIVAVLLQDFESDAETVGAVIFASLNDVEEKIRSGEDIAAAASKKKMATPPSPKQMEIFAVDSESSQFGRLEGYRRAALLGAHATWLQIEADVLLGGSKSHASATTISNSRS